MLNLFTPSKSLFLISCRGAKFVSQINGALGSCSEGPLAGNSCSGIFPVAVAAVSWHPCVADDFYVRWRGSLLYNQRMAGQYDVLVVCSYQTSKSVRAWLNLCADSHAWRHGGTGRAGGGLAVVVFLLFLATQAPF